MNSFAISTQDLAKQYREVRAVDELSLRVPAGAVYGFLGRNGAGKTTTIKMLLGLTQPNAGSARVLGLDIRRDRLAILQRTAYVSENKVLFDSMNAAELFGFEGGLLGPLMGLGFGASGVGNHASRGLREFLFTRPRRRKHFAWASWLAGASQVLLPVILAAFVLGCILAFMSGHFLVSSVLFAALGVGLPSLAVFSLSHWLTALTRNPGRGIMCAAGVCVGYTVLASFAELRMRLPHLSALLASPISYHWIRFMSGRQVPFIDLIDWNWAPIAYQSLLVLVFAFLAQRTVERMEA
jgi:ABC-type transport system involved in multi-copper enzyme maturation permease subunit